MVQFSVNAVKACTSWWRSTAYYTLAAVYYIYTNNIIPAASSIGGGDDVALLGQVHFLFAVVFTLLHTLCMYYRAWRVLCVLTLTHTPAFIYGH